MEKRGSSPKELSIFSGVMICLNCAIGATIYGIPWGFTQLGWAFSLILCLFGFFYLLSIALIFLQVLSRMEVLHNYELQGCTISPISILQIFTPLPPSAYIIPNNEDSDSIQLIPLEITAKSYTKHDMISVCRTLLGLKAEKLLSFIIISTSTVFLIGCTSTFASSMASLIPLGSLSPCDIFEEPSFSNSCRYQYWFFIGVFAVIAALICLVFEFNDQQSFLIAVGIGRILVILLMVCTIFVLIGKDKDSQSDDELDPDVQIAILSGFGVSVPIIFWTMGFHVLLPDLTHFLVDKKKNAQKVVVSALVLALSLIMLLGFTCLFGLNDTEPLVTLNWKDYSNGKALDDRSWTDYTIAAIISIYPAIDVTSVFAIYLANAADNLNALRMEKIIADSNHTSAILSIRSILIVVSLLVPMYFYDLGVIFALMGCISMVVVIFFIPALALASLALVPEKCCYDSFLTSHKVLIFFIVFGFFFLVLLWTSFIGSFFY